MKTINEFKFIKPSARIKKNADDLGGWGPLKGKDKKFFEKWCHDNCVAYLYMSDLRTRKLLKIIKSNEYDIKIFNDESYPEYLNLKNYTIFYRGNSGMYFNYNYSCQTILIKKK